MTDLDFLATGILASFRKGRDTSDIARNMRISEAKVSRLLWVARCRERGLPATFLSQSHRIKQIAPKVA